jgi:hypothetical protein
VLVPIQELPALIASIKRAIEPSERRDTAAEERAEFRDLTRSELRRRMFMPRIGSGVIAGACAFLLTIGEKFEKDPLLGSFVTSVAGHVILLVALVYAAMLFVVTWLIEQREAERSEWLATEEGRRFLLADVLNGAEARNHAGLENRVVLRFTLADMVHAIRGQRQRSVFIPFTRAPLSSAAAATLAKVHLDDLVSRGLIERLPGKKLDVTYEMDSELMHEVRRDGFRDGYPAKR